ncbi:MAG: M56 family metallopeptidase [Wenzhouxiangellaceae bacterium]
MSADLLAWLAEATLLTSAAIVLVLLLRPGLRRLFGVRAAILLWTLVPLAGLVSIVPDRIVEIDPATDRPPVTIRLDGWLQQADPAQPVDGNAPGVVRANAGFVLALWLTGGTALLVLMVRRQQRFRARLGRLRAGGSRLWISQRTDIGPLLLGLLAPKIIVPHDFARRFDVRQRRLMLAHEYTHLRRGDPIWNLLAAGVRCLFWFNPLAHLAATEFRRDQELACDARVLATRRRSRRRYADALVALEHPGRPLPVLTFGPHPLKERIMQIATLKPETAASRRLGAGIILTLSAVLALAAWAGTPDIPDSNDTVAKNASQEWFTFDVELTVEGRTQVGSLTIGGDEARVRHDGSEYRMLARDTLIIEHQDEDTGWAADVAIQRHGDDQFRIDAEIRQHGEIVATPTMIVGAQSPAWVQQSDPETGEVVYRLKFTPISPELPPSP